MLVFRFPFSPFRSPRSLYEEQHRAGNKHYDAGCGSLLPWFVHYFYDGIGFSHQ